MEFADTVRDLGVETDCKLSYDYHIENIVRQAYMRVGVLFKSFVSRDCDLLRQAYVTYIRPLLEYACNVWSPYKFKHIRAIEKIQRHFTRRIPAMRDLSYDERLARLNLESLEIRRVRSDLVLYYKIFNGLTNFNPSDVFDVRQNVRLTRSRDKLQLCRPMCKSKVLENNFFVRRIACWNMLPDDVKNLSSVSQFKKALMFTDLSNSLLLK